jgi:hypothetical protein
MPNRASGSGISVTTKEAVISEPDSNKELLEMTAKTLEFAKILESAKTLASSKTLNKCPECGHVFQGQGWGGIDAHWRAHHNDIMRYEYAWPLISTEKYQPMKTP